MASPRSQARARLGPGGYCRRSGNGGPQTCLPAAHSEAKQQAIRPIFINKVFKTLARVQASRGGRRKTSSGVAWPGRLTRSEDIKAGQTSRGSRDVSRDDRHQAGASACSVLVSYLVLRRQAQAQSTEASGKGFHIGATRPRPVGRQDGGHHGAQDGVITSAFTSRRPALVRITCTRCSPSKWPLLAPFPLNIWGEDQCLYK